MLIPILPNKKGISIFYSITKPFFMKKKLLCFSGIFLSCLTLPSYAQAPVDYYQSAVGKKKEALKTALSSIMKSAGNVGYDGLYTVYRTSDARTDGKVWDMYSNITNFSFSQTCGNYKNEGDCFNREHSIPQSWFSSRSPMQSDAWHVVPTDGKINGVRSNYPLGEVGTVTTASKNNFSKLGSSKTPGFSGTVFEPNDLYKGDFARMYFYMATRYQDQVGSWSGGVFAASYPHLTTWTLNLMLKWHRQDPVSQKEIDRNNAIYKSGQRNRNPYIDYPELVELVFGNRQSEAFDPENTEPGDPELPPFGLLPESAITHNSFTVNWNLHPNAEDYELKVYTLDTEDNNNTKPTTLYDFKFTSTSLPTGWKSEGYCSYEAGKGLRLASGSSNGSLSSPSIAAGEYQLIINWATYGSDKTDLYIYQDGMLIETLKYKSQDTRTDTIYFTFQQASQLKIEAKKSLRAFLKQIILSTGTPAEEVLVSGYPQRTGNVSTFKVENLKELTDYYYQLWPIVNGVKETPSPVSKVTTAIANSINSTYEADEVIIYVDNNHVNLQNLPFRAMVNILDMSGKNIASYRAIQEEESFPLPEKGIYFLQITHSSMRKIHKIYNY